MLNWHRSLVQFIIRAVQRVSTAGELLLSLSIVGQIFTNPNPPPRPQPTRLRIILACIRPAPNSLVFHGVISCGNRVSRDRLSMRQHYAIGRNLRPGKKRAEF